MKGILFTEPMFRAVVAGTKTQTRRLGGLDYINAQEDVAFKVWETDPEVVPSNDESKTITWKGIFLVFKTPHGHFEECYVLPCYQPGDIVYLKEPYQVFHRTHTHTHCEYLFDLSADDLRRKLAWKNKLFMPAKYARYFIRIKDVRVERLSAISDNNIRKEGFQNRDELLNRIDFFRTFEKINRKLPNAILQFVFAYTFELAKQPETLNLKP